MLPLSDENVWYYPSHGHDSDEEELNASATGGNWGQKTAKNARWVRSGKMASWGPRMDDWQVRCNVADFFLLLTREQAEERARKRIKLLLPQARRSPSPPTLPHLLRSPSPPLVSPYPPPTTAHLSYTSFVMDKSVTHTFRSNLLDELENATNGLIEGEAAMRSALGRLWQVISEDPDLKHDSADAPLVPKREDIDDGPDGENPSRRRFVRTPDLTPPAHKLFLPSFANGGPPVHDPSPASAPAMQLEALEKGLATLRELHDDGREYVERLEEIRESIGDVRAQRNTIWDVVRDRAITELQDAAFVSAGP